MITNGVDLDELRNGGFEDKPKPATPHQPKTIGYVGQLSSRKNVIDIIRAFDLLYREDQDIQLIIIGDGPQRNELEHYARSLSCADKIQFLGYREDRIKMMREFDLFCMTSSLEGIPRAMMEAMALGIPVCAYQIPGIDKLIIHNETGLLAEFGKTELLRKCWKMLLYDIDFLKKLRENGKYHIVENFSANTMAKKYEFLYQEIINNTSPTQDN